MATVGKADVQPKVWTPPTDSPIEDPAADLYFARFIAEITGRAWALAVKP